MSIRPEIEHELRATRSAFFSLRKAIEAHKPESKLCGGSLQHCAKDLVELASRMSGHTGKSQMRYEGADRESSVGAQFPIIEFTSATRHHLSDVAKADRQITDLFHFADLDRATDVILQKKDGWKHPRVVFFLPQAASGETGYLAQPLIVSVVVKPNGNFVSTFWRAGRRRWDRLVASEGVTVLKE